MKKLLVFVLLTLVGTASQARSERVVVPLTHPDQPVTIEVELVNGSIDVEAHDGREVIVDVVVREVELPEPEGETRDGMRRLPNTGIGFSVEEADNVVEISSDSWRRTVDVSLKVPVDTSLYLSTVNHGEIKVRGVRGELELENTNGPIEALDVGGSVVAHTTNGTVRVELVEVAAGTPMAFSTFNGDVDVTFPAGLEAELHMRSDNGDILTDFEVELMDSSPKIERESDGGRFHFQMQSETRGKVNGGGPEMTFRTYNGDIVIRKGK